ncbi:ABC transporter permease [Ramlibacter algicola]|uniref:ABC transporter permease n=1 Tax=Ramlibacter algicola TaxID=2795217 RepID=UPI001EF0CAD3|nr:ABC transporter permease [Ramlibacter algicola]
MKRIASWALLFGVLAAWEALARAMQLSALVLPPPTRIAQSLWNGLASGYFWPHLRTTTSELLLGLLTGCAIGFGAGVVLAEVPALRKLLMPYVVVSQVVPKLALMPLLIVWFGFGVTSTVLVTALICFFPLLENTMTGLAQVPPERLELFRLLGASPAQTLWRLKLPTGLPAILAGVRIAVVLALVGAVVGEFIGASQGLGALIIAAQGSMDTPLLFAVLVLVSLLGLAAYQAAVLLERRLLRPYHLEGTPP